MRNNNIFRAITTLMIILITFYSCKKGPEPAPVPALAKSELAAKLDGVEYKVAENGLTGSIFTDGGDAVKGVEVNAALDGSGRQMTFFVNDLKSGKIILDPKKGTSFLPYSTQLLREKLQAGVPGTTMGAFGPGNQNYIRYEYAGNSYYAFTGFIEITYDEPTGKITMSWSITFKDAAGREFTSTGGFTIYTRLLITKAKSEAKDPTPISAKPTIESITPTAGQANTEVSIMGTNFSATAADNVVKFNGLTATVKNATTTTLVVTAPQGGTTGAISVKVKNSDVANGPVFSYVLPSTFTALSPSNGKTGDIITLTGTNFSTVLTDNVVYFASAGSTLASAVLKSATTGQLTVEVPASAITGAITVNVKGIASTPANGFNTNFTVIVPSTTGIIKVTIPSVSLGNCAIDADGNFWIMTYSGILQYNYKGELLQTIAYTQLGSYGYFVNGCFDDNGNMFIAWNTNATGVKYPVIVKYDKNLTPTVISAKNNLPYSTEGFEQFTAGADGMLYFSEHGSENIMKIDQSGKYSLVYSKPQNSTDIVKSVVWNSNSLFAVIGTDIRRDTGKGLVSILNLPVGDKDGTILNSPSQAKISPLVASLDNHGQLIFVDNYAKMKQVDKPFLNVSTIAGSNTASELAGAPLSTKITRPAFMFCSPKNNVIYLMGHPNYVSNLNYFQILSYN